MDMQMDPIGSLAEYNTARRWLIESRSLTLSSGEQPGRCRESVSLHRPGVASPCIINNQQTLGVIKSVKLSSSENEQEATHACGMINSDLLVSSKGTKERRGTWVWIPPPRRSRVSRRLVKR